MVIIYGKYPESLSDLKFTGDWDAIHTGSVTYRPSRDRMSYFVAVKRNELMNKDHVELPAEFWQGTGFDPSL
jgi:hypothetical protein